MQEWVVHADRVSKRYGKTNAVRELRLTIPRGAVCSIVGPNGAGKSTTISMLLGLIRPTQGRLRVLGLEPHRQSFEVRQQIGYVPERHNIYQWMKVPQALRFAAPLYRRWDRKRADDLVAALRLPVDRRISQLSRGQVSKLALVIAIAHEPPLLILDEPTSGLDPIVRREVLDIIQQLVNRRESTVLFSTHILPDVERLAERVIIMNDGMVLADEPLDVTRARYIKASLLFDRVVDELTIPQSLRRERALREWVVLFPPIGEDQVRRIARDIGAANCMIHPASLDDVFVELVGQRNGEGGS